ncbi:hypothetical protein T07_5560 [Trichinella nelsoni]|uniref:Uncharacterized protein n=1 Tax=Trichinella nelsoni TaxID=6336 RepID=A0A0V0RUS0_9BILA|nr:hypothetical protein T07_5560 [Trichinella nelsoni]
MTPKGQLFDTQELLRFIHRHLHNQQKSNYLQKLKRRLCTILNHMHLDLVEESIKCKLELTEIELQGQNKKYEILSYNGCKFKDFYEKHIVVHLDFYVIGHPVSYVILKNIPFYCKNHSDSSKQFWRRMNIFITLFAFIAMMQQFSVDSNELRMQKRLDPQYFQLGFGKRFTVNEENYPTNMQCCAHKKWLNSKRYLLIAFHLTGDRLQITHLIQLVESTLSSELLQIAKQNLLSEESVEITEEYY